MSHRISLFDWRSNDNIQKADSIGEDLILIENPKIEIVEDSPFKVDVTCAVVCTKGFLKGAINLKEYTAAAPALIVVLPHQILELYKVSQDFEGFYIIMSDRFIDSLTALNIKEKYLLRNSVKNQPWTRLNREETEKMKNYFNSIQQIIRKKKSLPRGTYSIINSGNFLRD